MRTRWCTSALAALVFCMTIGAAALRAQGSHHALITGKVSDITHAVVPGATIRIAGSALIGGPRSTVTDDAGVYRFAALPPGVYEISTTHGGFRAVRRTAIELPAGTTIVVDFEVEPAEVSDIITVEGHSPMVDVKSPAAHTSVDQQVLHHLPTSRNVASILNLVPGIGADVSFGGAQKSNEILVDGVRMTEPLFQDPWTRLGYNWVEEVQVVALGPNAEYGGFTGAVANNILRSGSNRFSGLGEYWTIRPRWLDQNTGALSARLQRQFESRQMLAFRDAGAQLGGPLAHDRVWFFAGLEHSRHTDRPAGFRGPGERDESDLQALLKLTSALSPNVRLEGFIQPGRHVVSGEFISASIPIESSNDVRQPQTAWNARLTWALGARSLLEARHGGYVSPSLEEPHPPGSRAGPAPHYDYATQTYSVNTNVYFEQDSTQHTTSVAFTRYLNRPSGRRHELKAGVEYEGTDARQDYGYPGGRLYWDFFGQPDSVDVWAGDTATAGTGRTVVFAQDAWAITDRLTVSPGIRWERNRGRVPVKGTVFATDPVSPRIGLAWDVASDHRMVVRVHYGRFHDPIFSSRIMQADTSKTSPYIINAIVDGQFVEMDRYLPENNFAIDSRLRHSRVNQLVAGVERELFSDFSLLGQYIRRYFDTFMGLVDVGSVYEPVARRDPGPDGRFGTSDDGDLLTVYNVTNPGKRFLRYTNPEQAFNRYHALQVVARKRYSRRWQMQASYTWSRNEGTVGNRWHVNAARFDLGTPGSFVNPNGLINASGRAPFDPTHEAKLLGTVSVPAWGGFRVSAIYRYTTGQAWGRLVYIQRLRQGGETIRVEPRGTRRLPAVNRLDLRVEKTVPLRARQGTLGLFVDAFNLTNQGVPGSDVSGPVVPVSEYSGTRFGEPTAWLDPRMLRAGIRFTF